MSDRAAVPEWEVELDRRLADGPTPPPESASERLAACYVSVRFSTAPYCGLPTTEWLTLLEALTEEGCTATSVDEDRGVWHGHSVGVRVWTITGPGRELSATQGWNCCTGKPHLVGLEGYCPEWAPKMAYAASVSSGPQRERALQAAEQCAAMTTGARA